jgi:hypothetical protein
MSGGDQEKVATAMVEGPQLLRRALAKSLRGEGPAGLERDALRSWWLKQELGD